MTVNDSAIIDLYWARKEQALEETDLKYGGFCRTIAYNILHSREDSEECVNDTWMRAWNTMPPQRPSVLQSFLGKITRNLSLDRYKASRADKRGGGQMPLALEELGGTCRRRSAAFFCGATGMWIARRRSPSAMKWQRAASNPLFTGSVRSCGLAWKRRAWSCET